MDAEVTVCIECGVHVWHAKHKPAPQRCVNCDEKAVAALAAAAELARRPTFAHITNREVIYV